ncbi:MAG: hypothetical protein AAGJ10_02980 [Bacteroidota bacterium]
MRSVFALPLLLCLFVSCSAEEDAPASNALFEERDGLLVVEAESFERQLLPTPRQWYISTFMEPTDIEPDGDDSHARTASGEAYLEILPDTRRTHDDELITGENFSNAPGQLAILGYPVRFNTAGRYYVWVRAFSTGTEDNGIHVGVNFEWPASGQRMQWCEGKNQWTWASKQRTDAVHCGVPGLIYIDIPEPGDYTVNFSMREDGFEFDKWIMTTDPDYVPSGAGPAEYRIDQ